MPGSSHHPPTPCMVELRVVWQCEYRNLSSLKPETTDQRITRTHHPSSRQRPSPPSPCGPSSPLCSGLPSLRPWHSSESFS